MAGIRFERVDGTMREVFAYLGKQGTLLAPDALRYLQAQPQPLQLIEAVLASGPAPLMVTMEMLAKRTDARALPPPGNGALTAAVQRAVVGTRQVAPAPPSLMPILPAQPIPPPAPAPLPRLVGLSEEAARAHGLPLGAPGIEVLKDISGKSTCTGDLADFSRYFNDRLKVQRRMLRQRRELAGAINIDRIPNQDGIVKLIGMVSEVRKTKNGHRILELEDETGTAPLFVPQGDHRHIEVTEDAERLMQDEVIGVLAKVRQGKDLLYLEEIFRPDVPNDFAPHRATEPALACFISDVHFGAKTFLESRWDRFVRFLSGQGGDREERERAAAVKFVVIAGDVVDGIGVYPGQDHELAIPDIEGQYEFAAKQLARIPERIRVVMLPGNHDAVRPAEPQPAMSGDRLTKHFTPNVTQVGNPCHVSLMGVEVLAYHGVSLIDFITQIRGLNVHQPVAIMEELLKRRHIAPLYGGHTPIAPEFRDYMVIDRVPDVFVTGHLHTCDMGQYKGVTLINAGTWQAQTSYQKTLGIDPHPAKVATMDLQTGARFMLDFNQD